jgi:uncharacterized membrane protein YhaH (DUF805 family)
MFALFSTMFSAAFFLADSFLGTRNQFGLGLFNSLYVLAIALPAFCVTVRRLHDTNHSGWWCLITLVPFVGAIIQLIFLVRSSTPGENKYGPNPANTDPILN